MKALNGIGIIKQNDKLREKTYTLQSLFDEITPKLATVTQLRTFLKGLFQLATDKDVISKNIVGGIVIKKRLIKKKESDREDYLPRESISSFYKDLSDFLLNRRSAIYERDILLYHLLFLNGLRIGEALSLRWEDIDFDNRIINVDKTQIQIKGQYIEGDMP